MKVGEHRRQRMGAVEVGAAVRADDLHARVLAEAQKMPQQQQRGLGRPVKVVENQDDGCARGGDPQQRDDGVEKCVAFGVRDRREAARPDRAGHRSVREPMGVALRRRAARAAGWRRGRAPATAALPRTAGRAHRGPRHNGRKGRRHLARRPDGDHSPARRVLPTPGSPAISTARVPPASAVCHADRSRSSSRPRPTNGPGPASTAGRPGRSMGASVVGARESSAVSRRSSNTCSGRARFSSWRIPRSASMTSSDK